MTDPDTTELLASAAAVRRHSADQRGWLAAEFDQRRVDAEVQDTRSRLNARFGGLEHLIARGAGLALTRVRPHLLSPPGSPDSL